MTFRTTRGRRGVSSVNEATERLEIEFLSISYVPVRTRYNADGEKCGGSAPIGKFSIDSRHMPKDLRDRLVEFVLSVEEKEG